MQGRRSDNSTPQLASIQMARLVCMSISTTVIHGKSYIRRSHALQRERECPTSWIIGMYGPPPRRKRNLKTPQVGLRKCIRPLLEWITPGQDGMRCALFSINWSVSKDYLWSAASPQAKFEDATSWSAQMYTAFVGVDHSWPGWNALGYLLY